MAASTRSSPEYWGYLGTETWPESARRSQENLDFPYILMRNEQAGVHMAAGFAKASNRLRTFACTSSIGPGATNMITGAALATINRLPVLLAAGRYFCAAQRGAGAAATRVADDAGHGRERLLQACLALLGPHLPAGTTDHFPSRGDARADFAIGLRRGDAGAAAGRADRSVRLSRRAVSQEGVADPEGRAGQNFAGARGAAICAAERPLIVCGGGVLMSEASQALSDFAGRTGIPVAETQAGKGALAWNHAQVVGAIGATGSLAANRLANAADLVIGIGTRYSDFTTASMTAFQNPNVKFVNINTAEFDAYKVGAIPVVADARVALEQLGTAAGAFKVSAAYAAEIAELKAKWDAEVDRLFDLGRESSLSQVSKARPGAPVGDRKPAQSEVIGAMWEAAGERDVLLSAAGSHPGDLHKLWRTRAPNGYHMEYGYSCMGYEIPGAMGAKMADPSREVFVFLGDGTYLMAPAEIATSVQEGVKIIIVLVDNGGFASIGSLSRSLGQGGFGTRYRLRDAKSGQLDGAALQVDFAANARSLGAHAIKAGTLGELKKALEDAKAMDRTTVIVVETDASIGVPGYDSWWDVAVAEVSEMESVREARARYEEARKRERHHL
jgi:3D-(3,5/4)-trihydroxycyclohexane-1,2-dione acylhydrolase (decyclizing)